MERPVVTRSSRALSNEAESLFPGSITGKIFGRSSPSSRELKSDSRASIQNRLPLIVLISPLCAINLKGWARSQEGNVLVLNLECTRAIALSILSSPRSL